MVGINRLKAYRAPSQPWKLSGGDIRAYFRGLAM
jgi:hypothetical protein